MDTLRKWIWLCLTWLGLTLAQDPSCGYGSCPQPKADMLNVHLIAHSHDDVGWLMTVDEYFMGFDKGQWELPWHQSQKAGVGDIIDSALRALLVNPDRKYIQVEIAFFWRWWQEQNRETRDLFKTLVDNGQLEFIGGGWSMTDEGATHYLGIIDNMALGFKLLNQTFGSCSTPRVGWQIDPFGHSREYAFLFKKMGFDGTFVGRIDWRDKERRKQDKEMEMMWHTSEDVADADLFTAITYFGYEPPKGFCWDYWCEDDPVVDGAGSRDNNIDQIVQDFLAYAQEQAQAFDTDNIMICMGLDFHYQAAHVWFKNLDKLISHANALQINGSKVNLMYSTPSCYLKAVQDSHQGSPWPVKDDDFFPYASDPHAFWSGYFSSRPTSKRLMHESSQMLQVAKQMSSALRHRHDSRLDDVMKAKLALEKAVGVAQHHDAITGTEKQYVSEDYHERLVTASANFMTSAFANSTFTPCPLLNVSQCHVSETNDVFTVNVYNPLGRKQSRYIRVPIISDQKMVVSLPDGNPVASQITPIPTSVLSLSDRNSTATFELVFLAQDLEPLSSRFFEVRPGSSRSGGLSSRSRSLTWDKDLNVKVLSLNGIEYHISQEIKWYTGTEGDNSDFDHRASGAYIYRPEELAPNPFPPRQAEVFTGDLFEEVHEVYNDWISQVTRIYFSESVPFDMQVEWLVGPIPVDDGLGKEIVNVLGVAEIDNGDRFWTDANGRQLVERIRDFKLGYDINNTEPVAHNLYPVNTRIGITSDIASFFVLNDRSQGGMSRETSQVELLIHRRLLFDDDFGVMEALQDDRAARGSHYLVLADDPELLARHHRTWATELFFSPVVTFSASSVTPEQMDLIQALSPGLGLELPENINLITLEPWYTDNEIENEAYLVRLEHCFQSAEHSTLSLPVSLDLSQIFSNFGTLVRVKETSLGANIFLDDVESSGSWWSFIFGQDSKQNQFEIELRPMDIRTFIIEFEATSTDHFNKLRSS